MVRKGTDFPLPLHKSKTSRGPSSVNLPIMGHYNSSSCLKKNYPCQGTDLHHNYEPVYHLYVHMYFQVQLRAFRNLLAVSCSCLHQPLKGHFRQ